MKLTRTIIEEILEGIWVASEDGKNDVDDINISLNHLDEKINPRDVFNKLEKDGYITLEGKKVLLTKKGEELARNIIRRHRLAERLLHDIFSMENSAMESAACQFEHILSREITDKVCTFLGHPPTCPHGKRIPRGECCKTYKKKVEPLMVRLSELPPGKNGRIAFIIPGFHERFDRLTSMGVIPGTMISIHQTRPTFLVRIGETELAIDKKIAEEIYVVPMD